jgi:hypothetical protein
VRGKRSILNRSLSIVILATLALTAFGCGSSARPWESRPIFLVEGRVLVQGKAAEGVEVTFQPIDSTQKSRPRGVTDHEGMYRLRTNRDDDGAPAGEYVVTLYWPKWSDSKVKDEPRAPPDRLGRRFLFPTESSFRARVEERATVVPPIAIDLPKKLRDQ